MIDTPMPSKLDKRDYRLGNSMADYRRRRVEKWLSANGDLPEAQRIRAERSDRIQAKRNA